MATEKSGARMTGFIDKLASAIATAEGFFHPDPTVAPRRNNNPGDLMEADPAHPGKMRLRKFATAREGTAWLYFQIALDIRRGLTLRQFISKFAPPTENNTANYIAETSRRVGIPADEPMLQYLELNRIP